MSGRPAVLLDRDGTIIVERDYLSDPALVELETGAVEGLRALAEAGFVLAVLTNQSGIGRGYFDLMAAKAVNARVAELLAAEGIVIAGWYLCPHAPDEECDCRKPRPGMARQAAEELGLDLARSWVIGDKSSDVGLADAVGARSILVTTGHGRKDEAAMRAQGVPVCATLVEAAGLILA
ncbi:D-glycero-alpha-D-manno-heptose-1,7-bisphosphate 7-phosphatase [Sphingomonas sp. PR090111-T3T-6A]|uniref:D-glycero-alpha-D-manno-heptose-1,7-bisphosphate 7-phosphatase n=1 Tax=Sphingomonas sp. PR090111-T3T-6A TaxID=685778 RepID=UPI000378B8FD|nr:HAD family hydrolase [Sphingomonas sp. PR090111-T3T-6A]